MTQSLNKLDDHWLSVLDKEAHSPLKKPKRFSMDWYSEHTSTKQLLNSSVLHGNVLDIGCGTGHRAFIASKQSKCNIIGIDGSKYAIHYANKNFRRSTLKFIVGDVTSMPLLNSSFNNAYMLAVIEHVAHTKLLLYDIQRIMAPKGKLFLCVTQNDYHSSPDHVHIFSEKSLLSTFRDFKIISSFVKSHIIFMTVQISNGTKNKQPKI